MIDLVMGVSGSGKTTIGEALAHELGWTYLDADDFHPKANIDKMAAGIPLEDADRSPWLEKINEKLLEMQKHKRSAVLGCSALKQAYRERLARDIDELRIVFLKGDFELIHGRVSGRKHRYMPASLLQSQFQTLEPPKGAIEVDVAAPIEASLAFIRERL
jgi:gluconokinase